MTEPAWKFESVVTTPDGVRTGVVVTVPSGGAWPDVGEVAEIAQMCASQASARLAKMLQARAERVPF
jgi:hypothetical protein